MKHLLSMHRFDDAIDDDGWSGLGLWAMAWLMMLDGDDDGAGSGWDVMGWSGRMHGLGNACCARRLGPSYVQWC
jgi:hypothetical protein